MLNVLIADDESLARESVKLLLESIPYISDIFEANDGHQALQKAIEYQPDIVVLDVEMPGISGVDVARHLPKKCVVIFATAYNNYAIEAFELNAIDYVLKPFEDTRFLASFERAVQRCQEKEAYNPRLQEALSQLTSRNTDVHKKRLVVKDPGRIRLIDVDCIQYIAGAGNYAELHLEDGRTVLHRETLCELERQLNPDVFVRIHRSTIAKRKSIVELRPNDKGDYLVMLENGDTLTLSRRNRDKLEELMQ